LDSYICFTLKSLSSVVNRIIWVKQALMCFCVCVVTEHFSIWRTAEENQTEERMDYPTPQTDGK